MSTDETQWDDLDEDTSIAIGILSELTAIREQLQRIGTALEADAGDEAQATMLRCVSCGEVLPESDAESHAVYKHKSHPDTDYRERLYAEIET